MSIGKRQSGDDEALELFEAFAEFVEEPAGVVEELDDSELDDSLDDEALDDEPWSFL